MAFSSRKAIRRAIGFQALARLRHLKLNRPRTRHEARGFCLALAKSRLLQSHCALLPAWPAYRVHHRHGSQQSQQPAQYWMPPGSRGIGSRRRLRRGRGSCLSVSWDGAAAGARSVRPVAEWCHSSSMPCSPAGHISFFLLKLVTLSGSEVLAPPDRGEDPARAPRLGRSLVFQAS
jgi:hypothetical protein